MVAYLNQTTPILELPGVWQDLPWISRERAAASPTPTVTKQLILEEFEGMPPDVPADSALWARQGGWDL